MKPRNLEIGELIDLLETEHARIKSTLSDIQKDIASGNIESAVNRVRDTDETLIQHMLDEEAVLLKAMIQAFGREGSWEAIEVFQEHVDIDSLVKEMKMSLDHGDGRREAIASRLSELLLSHFEKERTKIFPCARDAERKLNGYG